MRETNKARLSTGNATDSGVNLTHLICKIVKTSTKINLHLLKLRHDGHQGHTNCRRRRIRGGRSLEGGRNSRSSKIIRLNL